MTADVRVGSEVRITTKVRQQNEAYSITSSARVSNDGETVDQGLGLSYDTLQARTWSVPETSAG